MVRAGSGRGSLKDEGVTPNFDIKSDKMIEPQQIYFIAYKTLLFELKIFHNLVITFIANNTNHSVIKKYFGHTLKKYNKPFVREGGLCPLPPPLPLKAI